MRKPVERMHTTLPAEYRTQKPVMLPRDIAIMLMMLSYRAGRQVHSGLAQTARKRGTHDPPENKTRDKALPVRARSAIGSPPDTRDSHARLEGHGGAHRFIRGNSQRVLAQLHGVAGLRGGGRGGELGEEALGHLHRAPAEAVGKPAGGRGRGRWVSQPEGGAGAGG